MAKLFSCLIVLWALLISGCVSDGEQPSATTTPEPFDLASLNGKFVKFQITTTSSISPVVTEYLRIVGSAVLWKPGDSQCALQGMPYGDRLAIVYTVDQPRTGINVPCEQYRNNEVVTQPAKTTYSSTATLRGHVLELSGELTEHNSSTFLAMPVYGLPQFSVTKDVVVRQHMKVRFEGEKCHILEFSWVVEGTEVRSDDGRPHKWRDNFPLTGACIILNQDDPKRPVFL